MVCSKGKQRFLLLFCWFGLWLMVMATGSNSAWAVGMTGEQADLAANGDAIELTAAEQAYLEEHRVLRVMSVGGAAPILDIEENGEISGIARKVMDYLGQQLGVELKYVPANTLDELELLLQQGGGDLLLIPENYATALFPDIPLTEPFLMADTVLFYRNDLRPTELEQKICAVVKGASAPEGVAEENVLYCESRLEAVEKVSSGAADYGYGNGFSVSYYLAQRNETHVMMLPISDDTRAYCIGVVDGNPLLLSVLNKTLATIDDSLMQTFVMEACVIPEEPVTLGKIVEQFTVYIILFLLTMLFMVIIGATYIYRTNQKLRMQNTRLVTLAEVSGDLLFEYDIKLDRLLLFKGFRQTFGIPERDIAYHKADVADLIDLDSIIDRRITGEEIEYPNGRCYKAKYSYIQGESHGEPIYLVGKLVDISEDKAQLMALANKARMDGLTNLLNSAETRELVHKAMVQIPEGQMDALFIFDVDEFKQVNDTFGHYAGDQVLVQIAEILRYTFRGRDIVGRLGGDEFIAYMQGVPCEAEVEEICCSLLERLQISAERAGMTKETSVSMGVYLVTGGETFEQAYQQADWALYQAKISGKKRYCISDGMSGKKG